MLDRTAQEAPLPAQNDDENFQLSAGERRLIRNYRAMRRDVQLTFEDLSEEFALGFPAPAVTVRSSASLSC